MGFHSFSNGFTEVMRLDSSGNLGIGASSPVSLPIGTDFMRVTKFKDVPTEVLRNLWLVKFSGRVVRLEDLNGLEDDIIEIGQELANRKLLRFETQGHLDRTVVTHFYVLEKENADN